MFTGKITKDSLFFKIILATPITRKWDIKTHTYTSFKGPKTSKLDVKLLVKSHK